MSKDSKERGPPQSITKTELLGRDAFNAYAMAEYRLRHNRRYARWNDAKRIAYMLEKAFDAAAASRNVVSKARRS